MPQIDPHSSELPTIAGACSLCIRDSAHQCGMTGGARCPHIEQAGHGREPKAWIVSRTGIRLCLDFESDVHEAPARLH